jgi:hypothetical protein
LIQQSTIRVLEPSPHFGIVTVHAYFQVVCLAVDRIDSRLVLECSHKNKSKSKNKNK